MSRDWPVYWFEDIDSTNEEARRRAAGVASVQGQWIAAKRQSAGRGRLHRTWTTIDGNLFATALFSWENPFADAVRIPFAAGLAVVDACRRFAPRADLHLKWPNDVRAAGAKVAGILVETGGATTPWVAVGIGVNV
ncbi:MAG: biotin--[acetyl-CoA-carboxylase] ligase, partial [Pseudomonadota bacterium]